MGMPSGPTIAGYHSGREPALRASSPERARERERERERESERETARDSDRERERDEHDKNRKLALMATTSGSYVTTYRES